MNIDDLVASYFNAWNEASVQKILQHLTTDCVQYDHYWGTIVPCLALPKYLDQDFQIFRARYTLIGNADYRDDRITYKYRANIIDLAKVGVINFTGAEVLALHCGKINRITHLYDFPTKVASLYDSVGRPTVPAITATHVPEEIADDGRIENM